MAPALAAARGRQVADFHDLGACHGAASLGGDQLLHRRFEVAFQKQWAIGRAAVAGGGQHLPALAQGQQHRGEGRNQGAIALRVGLADAPLDLGALRIAGRVGPQAARDGEGGRRLRQGRRRE